MIVFLMLICIILFYVNTVSGCIPSQEIEPIDDFTTTTVAVDPFTTTAVPTTTTIPIDPVTTTTTTTTTTEEPTTTTTAPFCANCLQVYNNDCFGEGNPDADNWCVPVDEVPVTIDINAAGDQCSSTFQCPSGTFASFDYGEPTEESGVNAGMDPVTITCAETGANVGRWWYNRYDSVQTYLNKVTCRKTPSPTTCSVCAPTIYDPNCYGPGFPDANDWCATEAAVSPQYSLDPFYIDQCVAEWTCPTGTYAVYESGGTVITDEVSGAFCQETGGNQGSWYATYFGNPIYFDTFKCKNLPALTCTFCLPMVYNPDCYGVDNPSNTDWCYTEAEVTVNYYRDVDTCIAAFTCPYGTDAIFDLGGTDQNAGSQVVSTLCDEFAATPGQWRIDIGGDVITKFTCKNW
ncbi:Sushi domain-containing protein [Caenorhabditis elegans]|uniref:Sushi domain-containing protein n=1 Tax=Caenorhabditis elegans TaxID=6239 RepID=K8ESN2_CAEEL|nr:Sushi domain-containing protein [Caenorhabditis elegans]CCO25903.1 Sushi domain-containing protein [Caenorhabditis elegans]|eukprot:NP_507839.3 Uncharacterized protein CELE_Y116F11B.2 [Caenorhabditis elegans]